MRWLTYTLPTYLPTHNYPEKASIDTRPHRSRLVSPPNHDEEDTAADDRDASNRENNDDNGVKGEEKEEDDIARVATLLSLDLNFLRHCLVCR